MNTKVDQIQGMWAYLDSLGILEKGTDEEIKAAKRAYRKIYLKWYKKKQRSENGEFTILLSTIKGEYGKVAHTAKKHGLSIAAFLHLSAMAYLNKTFIVPDKEQVAHLEKMLLQVYKEIQLIGKRERSSAYERVIERIEKLEKEISDLFRTPDSIEEMLEKEIEKDSSLKERIIKTLTHDRQGEITQKTKL